MRGHQAFTNRAYVSTWEAIRLIPLELMWLHERSCGYMRGHQTYTTGAYVSTWEGIRLIPLELMCLHERSSDLYHWSLCVYMRGHQTYIFIECLWASWQLSGYEHAWTVLSDLCHWGLCLYMWGHTFITCPWFRQKGYACGRQGLFTARRKLAADTSFAVSNLPINEFINHHWLTVVYLHRVFMGKLATIRLWK